MYLFGPPSKGCIVLTLDSVSVCMLTKYADADVEYLT